MSKQIDFYRLDRVIYSAPDNAVFSEHKSINAAKRESRRLQTDGFHLRVITGFNKDGVPQLRSAS